jgi:phage tail P2-like protein
MDLNNVSILNLMPPNLASDLKIKMAAEAFDEVLRDIIKKIPNISVIPNLVLNKTVDAVLIDLLAWQFHVDFYDPNMPVSVKRDLVLKSLDWHFRKGTSSVVEDIVSTVFSKAIVQEWFEYDGLPYRFRVATDEQIPDTEVLNKLLRAIKSVKNVRSFIDSITQLVYFSDTIPMSELYRMTLQTKFTDDFFQTSERFLLFFGNKYEERHFIRAFHNGSNYRNQSIKRDGLSDKPIGENLRIWCKKHHFHNGVYFHNGTIKHDGMILIPLE